MIRVCVCGAHIPCNRTLCPTCWSTYGARQGDWPVWLIAWVKAYNHLRYVERRDQHDAPFTEETEYILQKMTDPKRPGGSYFDKYGLLIFRGCSDGTSQAQQTGPINYWPAIQMIGEAFSWEYIDVLLTVKALPTPERVPMLLKIDGYSKREISQQLGIDRRLVDSLIRKAQDILRPDLCFV